MRAVSLAWIKTVHTFAVNGIDVRNFLLERGDIHQRNEDDGTRDLGRVQIADELFNGDDGSVLRAVRAGDQREHFSWLRSIHHHDRDVSRSVHAGRHREVASRFLPRRGGGSACGKRSLCVRKAAKVRREKR